MSVVLGLADGITYEQERRRIMVTLVVEQLFALVASN